MRQHQEIAIDIFKASAQNLTILNRCVSQLARFFNVILTELLTGIEEDVRDFLQLVKREARLGQNYELESMTIGKAAKEVC
jgi:hypothetical protein